MVNICKVGYKITKSWKFDLIAWIPAILFMIAFLTWRWIVIESWNGFLFYTIFHSHMIFDLSNMYLVSNQIEYLRERFKDDDENIEEEKWILLSIRQKQYWMNIFDAGY